MQLVLSHHRSLTFCWASPQPQHVENSTFCQVCIHSQTWEQFVVNIDIIGFSVIQKSCRYSCHIRKVEEYFQWKTNGQCSKRDSCSISYELAMEAVAVLTDEEDDRPLPHQIRRPRLRNGETNPQQHQATKRIALQTQGAKFRADTENVTIRHVAIGILPYVKTTSLRLDANMTTSALFDMLRLRRSPAKSQGKVVRKDQLLY